VTDPYGVLLVNLGTPDAPRPPEVRRYLREFLSDPRVLDMPGAARWLLLHCVILPTRPRKSAEAYEKVWTDAGSPLLIHSEALAARVQDQQGDIPVALGMRYGNPGIAPALDELIAAGVRRIVVLPLFPQYSEAATGSALVRVRELAAARSEELTLVEVKDFYAHPGFSDAWRSVAAQRLERFAPEHVLLSYHGLPERQVTKADAHGHCLTSPECCEAAGAAVRGCYRAQCFATTRRLVEALGLDPTRTSTSFQSRLGRTPWILPHTDAVLPELHAAGVRRLAILCPAFVSDCLETLEEIGMQARDQWLGLGGEAFELLPCPTAPPAWARAVAQIAQEAAEGPGPPLLAGEDRLASPAP
jgi:ferrochelatase